MTVAIGFGITYNTINLPPVSESPSSHDGRELTGPGPTRIVVTSKSHICSQETGIRCTSVLAHAVAMLSKPPACIPPRIVIVVVQSLFRIGTRGPPSRSEPGSMGAGPCGMGVTVGSSGWRLDCDSVWPTGVGAGVVLDICKLRGAGVAIISVGIG